MDRKDFSRALAQHSLPSVLLFEGEEEQLKQEALEELRRAQAVDVARVGHDREGGLAVRDPNDFAVAPFLAPDRGEVFLLP